MKRKLITLAIIILCFLLQSTIFPSLAFACVQPNLFIIVTASFGFMRGRKEGMAVGVVLAQALNTQNLYSALALSIGIAIQNFPEGAILSLPLKSNGYSKHKAFLIGALSGIVEPIFGYITILFSNWILQCLPLCLSFAAGAMLFVVIEELVPEMAQGKHSNLPTISFLFGFCIMMVLDVILG